jgi:hypothetical protein
MAQGNHRNREQRGEPAARQHGRRSNWRTALVLLSIALVFFVGVIVNRLLFN